MGRYCLTQGKLATAEIGEELSIKQFPLTFAVINREGMPVCIPHKGCTLEMLTVDPQLAEHARAQRSPAGPECALRDPGLRPERARRHHPEDRQDRQPPGPGEQHLPDHRGEAPLAQLLGNPEEQHGAGESGKLPPNFLLA